MDRIHNTFNKELKLLSDFPEIMTFREFEQELKKQTNLINYKIRCHCFRCNMDTMPICFYSRNDKLKLHIRKQWCIFCRYNQSEKMKKINTNLK